MYKDFFSNAIQRRLKLIVELKACGSSKSLERGKGVHEAAIRTGDDSNDHVASTLISMYAKCGSMEDAHRVFDKLELRDVVTWTALILGYADNGEGALALDLFFRMARDCCAPDARTFVAVLKACTGLAENEASSGDKTAKAELKKTGERVHLLASRSGCDSNLHVECTLVALYAKCGSMGEARRVFQKMRCRDAVTWNALMLGYAENGDGETALNLFSSMRAESIPPAERSLIAAIKACADLVDMRRGQAIHLLSFTSGCDTDVYVSGTLIDMYAKCGSMEDAQWVFDRLKSPNLVCWNSLILGYADNGESQVAMQLFPRMRREGCAPDTRTFVAVLKACTDLVAIDNDPASQERGKVLHLIAQRSGCASDMYVKGSLVDMYGKCGRMGDAQEVFDSTDHSNVVCWNALILGYADNGEADLSLQLFTRMKREGCLPNVLTFSAVLKACGLSGALEFGRAVHAEIFGRGCEPDAVLTTSLVDFYAKCGSLVEARRLFVLHASRVSSWNALLAGYSRHGETKAVFDLFDGMRDSGVQPDGITFRCLLSACSHAGLVDKGKDYFESMTTRFGVSRELEHYACMVDVLGRANKLEDAMFLLRRMLFSANALVWTTVLGACGKWRKAELGKLAFECLMSLGDKSPATYVLMANMEKSCSKVTND